MTLQEKIREDMITAMKARETDVVDILRVAAGEFGRIGKDLDDGQVIKVIRKLSETAIELGNNREAEILEKYLPKMLDQTEISAIITQLIIDNGITNIKEMGKVMGLLSKHPQAAFIDNKFASAAIRLQLTNIV